MPTYYLYTFRPPYPEKRVKLNIMNEKEYCVDVLPSPVTSAYRVENVRSRAEAIAIALEKLAGKPTTVYQVI